MGPAGPGAGGASHWTRNSAGLPACPNAPPISLLVLPKEKRAVHGPKRKNASAGRSAQAQTSCRRRGMAGAPLQKSGTETPCPWGILWPGAVRDTLSDSPRCRSRFFEEQPAAAKREAAQCVNHPDAGAPSATGRQSGESQKAQACPKTGLNRSRHRYVDPRARGGPLHRSAPSAFLFGPCTARFSFGKTKEKWGVHPGWTSPPAGAGIPVAAVRRPISCYPRLSLRPTR